MLLIQFSEVNYFDIEKLSNKKQNETDKETINTIDQVLSKIQTESFSELNYYKLKNLNEGL